MKKIIKNIIGLLLGNNFIFNLLQLMNKKKLIILYYHRIVKSNQLINIGRQYIDMYTDLEMFDHQMKLLTEHYYPVNEEQVVDFMDKGEMPDHAVWVTFDDGWEDNYTNAFPILKKYNIPATFFITTGFVNKTVMPKISSGNDNFMNWVEIQEVAGSGIYIGAHTVSHRILSDLNDVELEREIIEAKNEIEKRLGRHVISFAYPVGKKKHYFLKKCAAVLNNNNFKLAVTTIGGFNELGFKKDRFNLRRVGLSYEDTLNIFKFKISLGGFWQK